jgi:hypothetical protein
MADFGQILLLPPPAPYVQRLPARENELAVNAEVQGSGGEAARAKRFRFRVHEDGASSETNTDLATRRTDSRVTLDNDGSAENATGQPSSRSIRYTRGDTGSGASSAFLAQAFAQEQLGEGLHNPPFAAASAAYTRTGAALNARPSANLDIHA